MLGQPERRGGRVAQRFLVNLDTDRIQAYIFGTPRLREIRGASVLLAELNDPAFVQSLLPDSASLEFCAGGAVKVVFGTRAEADAFVAAMQRETWQRTHLATMTEDILSFDGPVVDQLERSERRLRRAKESRATHAQLAAQPLFAVCQSCGLTPPVRIMQQTEIRELCQACLNKTEAGQPARSGAGGNSPMAVLRAAALPLAEALHLPDARRWKAAPPCDDLSDLGSLSSPRGYLGLIVADGNRMGERLPSVENYRDFSQQVRTATREALLEALLTTARIPIDGRLPFEVLILGGDDLAVFTAAHLALPVALRFCENFQRLSAYADREGHRRSVSASAGVVLAHASHPAAALHDLAEQLTRSAKALSNQLWRNSDQPEDSGTVDFMVVTTPSANPLSLHRDTAMRYRAPDGGRVQLFARPYRLDHLRRLLESARAFKTNQPPFSRSRLADLARALWSSPLQGSLDTLIARSRLTESHQTVLDALLKTQAAAGNDYPWKRAGGTDQHDGADAVWSSPLPDLLEIYDFVDETVTL